MRQKRIWLCTTALSLMLSSTVASQTQNDKAKDLQTATAKTKRAQKALQHKNVDEAMRALHDAQLALQPHASLNVPKVVVVHGTPKGFGNYYPAAGGVLSSRLLRLYVEVEDFTWQDSLPAQGDLKKAKLDVTGVFFDQDGQEIGAKPLGMRVLKTRSPHRRTYFGLEVKLGEKIPAGRYAIEVQVKDLATQRSAKKRVPVVVR